MNWSLRFHDLKSSISWIELPCFLNAVGKSCTAGAIHGVSQFMPARAIHCTSVRPRDNKKRSAEAERFLKFRPKVEIISWSFKNTVWYREYRGNTCDIVRLSCVFVRYREYREYRCIKCCTKLAPRSHQHSTLFCSTNWNLLFLFLVMIDNKGNQNHNYYTNQSENARPNYGGSNKFSGGAICSTNNANGSSLVVATT